MRFTALLVLIFMGAFTGTALAHSAVASIDPNVLVQNVFDAVMHGQWWAALAAGVIMVCAVVRKYMPADWTTGTKGDMVGTATAFLIASAGSIATWAISPGAVVSVTVMIAALKIGVAAIGGYTVIHKVASWLVGWSKLPAWAKPILALITTLVGSDAGAAVESETK